MKRRTMTKEGLDELAKTMPILSIEENQYYVGGGSFQCLINSMVAATTQESWYYDATACGAGSGEQTITLGGQTFPIRVTNYSSSYHPQVNAYYYSAGDPIPGNTINGEQSYRYKFGNKTASDSAMGVWIVIPQSAITIFEQYFNLNKKP